MTLATLTARDRRALAGAGVVIGAMLLYVLLSPSNSGPKVVGAVDSVPAAEKRLVRLRQIAATVPAKEGLHRRATDEMALREKGLIQAETAAQAQAQLLEIVRRLAKAQGPSIEVKSSELGQIRPLGDDYGEVSVSVGFDCQIEQLVNYLADLTAQPQLLATSELRVAGATSKEKTIPVRLTVAGVVPRKLVPEKKGLF